ncbi:hypothetical protein ABZ202_16840 [Streptomyces sp. NPDC006186]|uniref:hypothetical protein n=1 Tax=Streptomyces sp. NPDC006186 TaxID=3155248 RepID=UPI0033BC8127
MLGLLGALLSGCSDDAAAVPDEFCGVPVQREALGPLMPRAKRVVEEGGGSASWDAEDCILIVDHVRVVHSIIREVENLLQKVDWEAAAKSYEDAATRRVSFPGTAVIGSDGALVQIACKEGGPSYYTFTLFVSGEGTEKGKAGAEKVQRFVEDHVPAVAKRLKCSLK